MRAHLADAGIFELEHACEPEPERFRADFDRFDVVIPYYCPVPSAERDPGWPEQTRAALAAYVRRGGGLVIIHGVDGRACRWFRHAGCAVTWRGDVVICCLDQFGHSRRVNVRA